jgi:hypothetical protein
VDKHRYLQDYLFDQALKEHGIDCDFSTDHQNGRHKIGEFEIGVKFPRRYIDSIAKLDLVKQHEYSFIGHVSDDDGRQRLLRPYQKPGNVIKFSRYGRRRETKFTYEDSYYQIFCQSRYVLCPIHIGPWYVNENAWTYRMIESCFCRAIPVVFRETPTGSNFHRDIFFYWDDQETVAENYQELVDSNYEKALRYWTLQPSEISHIKKHLESDAKQ